jgi:hypothetical protein
MAYQQSFISLGNETFAGCESLASVVFRNTSGWWYSEIPTASFGTKIPDNVFASPTVTAMYMQNNYLKMYLRKS